MFGQCTFDSFVVISKGLLVLITPGVLYPEAQFRLLPVNHSFRKTLKNAVSDACIEKNFSIASFASAAVDSVVPINFSSFITFLCEDLLTNKCL